MKENSSTRNHEYFSRLLSLPMNRLLIIACLFAAHVFVTTLTQTAAAAPPAQRPNILFVTVDDMSCDSIGVFGCKLSDTSPTVDRLASQSLRFNFAHVQVGNCMPSRNVMFSGRYPHNNGVEGFYQVKNPKYPVLSELMHDAGYFTAVRHKVSHSTPYSPHPSWDLVLDQTLKGKQTSSKNVESYYTATSTAIKAAKDAGKPFYVNINIADPHKPFYGEGKQRDPNEPSRVFTADEVPVPGFLPDDLEVRKELALYYSSVRRADDCLAVILKALDESGQADNTVVWFLSDHGMPLPFAKTQLYYHSTHTPLIVRWPGKTKAGSVDDRHMVSSVDFLPTIVEALGLSQPSGVDGRSFEPLLRGESQEGRDFVVTEYNENSGGSRDPMRAIIMRDFGYIFNPWSDGERVMATATMGTATYRRMKQLAKDDAKVAARLDLFEHRVPEEMYNYAVDPDALNNLIDQPTYAPQRRQLTGMLAEWMVKTGDPMLKTFRGRAGAETRAAYMTQVEQEAQDRVASGVKKSKKKAGKKGKSIVADE